MTRKKLQCNKDEANIISLLRETMVALASRVRFPNSEDSNAEKTLKFCKKACNCYGKDLKKFFKFLNKTGTRFVVKEIAFEYGDHFHVIEYLDPSNKEQMMTWKVSKRQQEILTKAVGVEHICGRIPLTKNRKEKGGI